MTKKIRPTNWLKFLVGWLLCFIVRLNPFRLPNVEPILATQMPFARNYGARSGFFFGFISIVFYDLVTQKVGIWTWVTGLVYGLLGIGAYWFFRKRKAQPINYLKYGVIGTLLYDALTGLTIGPLVFKMPFMVALIGQIPFTARHLLGNVFLSLVLSPLVDKWVVSNESLAAEAIWAKLFRTT